MKQLLFLLTISVLSQSCTKELPSAGLNRLIRIETDSLAQSGKLDSLKMNLFANIPFNWDMLTIIHPYASRESLQKLEFVNLNSNLSKIIDMTYQDGHVQILLSKGDEIITIDTVRRLPIDFEKLKMKNKAMSINVLTRTEALSLNYKYLRSVEGTRQYVPLLLQ